MPIYATSAVSGNAPNAVAFAYAEHVFRHRELATSMAEAVEESDILGLRLAIWNDRRCACGRDLATRPWLWIFSGSGS